MKRQSVSQLLKDFNALYDSILLYFTEHFKELGHFILFSKYPRNMLGWSRF